MREIVTLLLPPCIPTSRVPAWGSAQACRLQKKIIHVTVELHNGNENGRELGMDRLGKIGMGFKFQMGMEWDGNGNEVIEMGGNWDKNLFPHISNAEMAAYCFASKLSVLSSINVGRKMLIFEPLADSEGVD